VAAAEHSDEEALDEQVLTDDHLRDFGADGGDEAALFADAIVDGGDIDGQSLPPYVSRSVSVRTAEPQIAQISQIGDDGNRDCAMGTGITRISRTRKWNAVARPAVIEGNLD
jgi:hypothetical protein